MAGPRAYAAEIARNLRAKLTQLDDRTRRIATGVLELADAVRAIEARTRRFGVVITDVAAGLPATLVPVTWATPYPDTAYTVMVGLQCGPAAQSVLSAGLQPGSKTPAGCTVQVVNAGANVIASVGVDVIVLRDNT